MLEARRVYLVDGTYELFRNFYAVPSRRDAAGREIGAARGLLSSLAALLRAEPVTHIACAFDHVIESFRNDLYKGYKTGEGIDPELLAQFPIAEDVTRALGITTWPMIAFEADDALATAASRFAEDASVERILVCSPDKDLMQVVSGARVVVYDRMRKQVFDEEAVLAKFGVPPALIPDYLALVGDSADGIPGIARWGAKSTAAVLSACGSLEAIDDDPARWKVKVRGAATLAQNLCNARSEARLYKQLATLRRDVPLEESLQDLQWTGPDAEALHAVVASFGVSADLSKQLQDAAEQRRAAPAAKSPI